MICRLYSSLARNRRNSTAWGARADARFTSATRAAASYHGTPLIVGTWATPSSMSRDRSSLTSDLSIASYCASEIGTSTSFESDSIAERSSAASSGVRASTPAASSASLRSTAGRITRSRFRDASET